MESSETTLQVITDDSDLFTAAVPRRVATELPYRQPEDGKSDADVTREALDRWLENRRLTRSEPEFGIGFKAITYAQIMGERRR